MRLLKTTVHPKTQENAQPSFQREASRAIVIRGSNILLLYTARYEDYSLPGGGIDQGEDKTCGLIRELKEETGAQNVRNIREFGRYDEHRPWHKNDFNRVHMISYCYYCDIDDELLSPEFEQHEISNGMSAHWVNINQAISHNLDIISNSKKQGLSIIRETFLLQLIAQEMKLD
ncbi:MAG: NUDIX domain-containing protein [Oceanospirillaceae bacterium]